MSSLRLSLLLPLVVLAACNAGDDPSDDTDDTPPPPLVEGVPMAGAAEGTLELPVGTPLAGFTSRCGCLGGTSRQDQRDSNYNTAFVPSTGVQIRPGIKAIWIDNGDRHLVMTKTDTIYAFDGVVEAVTARLEELTGEDLKGQVTHSGNHTHSSYGTFSKHEGLFLGHDKFEPENFARFVEQVSQVAYQAYLDRKPAELGFGVAKDFDPEDAIYSDRRGDNNGLMFFDDLGDEQWKKDPYMHMLRVDDAATHDPIAILFAWGMHPIVSGEGNSMVTADASWLVETEVAESFDTPVVAMYLQTGAGDASVRGRQDGWARMETVGVLARDKVLDLWNDIDTSADPILLETMSRSVPMNGQDIHVTRNGAVDWKYPQWDAAKEATHYPDNKVFAGDGEPLPDFDEWYTGYGAVFCGSGDFALPVGGLPNIAKERFDPSCTTEDHVCCPEGEDCSYATCMQISFMKILIETFFFEQGTDLPLPMDGMSQTYTAASQLGPLPVRDADGTKSTDDVLLSFFPGEPLHFYTEQWRHRVKDELGMTHTALFGYSMDHEGYLLIPEDWFMGGYEPDITMWGPLAGEWIMENVLALAKDTLQTDLAEPFDPERGPWAYNDWPMDNEVPDLSPSAGTRLTEVPTCEESSVEWAYWVPKFLTPHLEQPTTLQRVDGMIQLGWIGGDPGVDNPSIVLEREVGEGTWEAVTSHAGRIISEDMQDIALAWTPCPYFPATVAQTHYWWAVWQAVGHTGARVDLPEGTYRLHVTGKAFSGNDTEFPWDTHTYEVTSDPFEVVPAHITVTRDTNRGGVWLSMRGPAEGYRMIDLDGDSEGDNPVRGDLSVTWVTSEGGETTETVAAPAPESRRTLLTAPAGETLLSVSVTDAYGNAGSWSVPTVR